MASQSAVNGLPQNLSPTTSSTSTDSSTVLVTATGNEKKDEPKDEKELERHHGKHRDKDGDKAGDKKDDKNPRNVAERAATAIVNGADAAIDAVTHKSGRPVKRDPGKVTLFTRFKAASNVPNDFLLRLNRILGKTEDLSSVISTLYYIVRILGRFQARASSALSSLQSGSSYGDSQAGPPASDFFTQSTRLLWDARMTLRLFRILPIYARLRNLIANRTENSDTVLYFTSLFQCSLYGVSQLLENVAYLTERGIVPAKLTGGLSTKGTSDRSSALYTLAYRTWFVAVSCDVLHMIRKVHLMWQHDHEKSSSTVDSNITTTIEGQAETWWPVEFLLPVAWYPVGWQLTSWFEDSSPGFNTRLHTAASMLADFERTFAFWKAADAPATTATVNMTTAEAAPTASTAIPAAPVASTISAGK